MLIDRKGRGRLFLFWTALSLTAFLLMIDPAGCAELVKGGLQTVVKRALPAVFPYLVLSSLLFESGFPQLFKGRVARLFGRLFHLPDCCVSGIVIGLFAGFPLGASYAAGLYAEGRCTKEEAERLSALSGFPAPPFLLGAFGQGVMGSALAGLLLYAVQTAAVFLYGVLLGRSARKREKSRKREGAPPFLKKEEGKADPFERKRTVPALFPMVGVCIGRSALQMVRIGGYILFFFLISGLILDIFSPIFSLFPLLEGPVAGFFEISSGVAHINARGAQGMLAGGLVLCFSGLSVHMQVAGFLVPAGLSVKEHLLAHLRLCPVIALLSAALCALFDLF